MFQNVNHRTYDDYHKLLEIRKFLKDAREELSKDQPAPFKISMFVEDFANYYFKSHKVLELLDDKLADLEDIIVKEKYI